MRRQPEQPLIMLGLYDALSIIGLVMIGVALSKLSIWYAWIFCGVILVLAGHNRFGAPKK